MTVITVIKYLLFTFNFIFFLVGLITVTLLAYFRNHRRDYQITDDALPAINLLIFGGLVILFFSFLGSCGAIRESIHLLSLLFMGLLFMFFILVSVGVLGAISRTTEAQKAVKKHVQQLIPLSEQPLKIQTSFQDVQRKSFCCGLFQGHQDWGNSSVIPDSCNCTDTSRNCAVLDGREIYSTPCMVYEMTWMDRASVSVIGMGFGFGALMLLGMAPSMVLI